MARAYPASQPQGFGQEPPGEEWSDLRGELVALLDEVESQVARTRQRNPGYQSIAERMDDLRYQVANTAPPDTRHREALRSVKRAVDRFTERDDAYAPPPPPQYEPRQPVYAGNPRDTLQSAIQQIRARHPEVAPAPVPAPFEPARPMESPRFDELAHAVGGISGRLERLEVELRTQGKSQTGNVKEIAEQVAQLSHVVELLAGAVGETGQVKRLEGQIAGLAKLVAEGSKADLATLGKRIDETATSVAKLIERGTGETSALRHHSEGMAQRLDDVTATMGRLADLQVQFANRVEASANATGSLREGMRQIEASMRDASGGAAAELKDGMRAVEESVRNIYDRIDAIEKNTAMSPIDVDKLTDEMARFTEAMKNPVQPQGLIELVDALNTRIAAIETSSGEVGGLKLDVEALRSAVIDAMEPRFTAIEMQIEALSDRVSERPAGADISVGQLEAQVRQLVARMDQTGEQLTGLAKLYSQPQDREPAPDFEALAEMVAARTSEAMSQSAIPAPAGLSDAGIDEIERRISRLVSAAAMEKPAGELLGIEISIREVSDRLARLETSLSARAEEEARIAAMPVEPVMPVIEDTIEIAPSPTFRPMMPEPAAPVAEPVMPPAPEPISFDHDPIAPLLAEAEAAAMEDAKAAGPTAYYPATPAQSPPRSDAMPASPDEDAPLVDRPFADTSPLLAALDAKNGPRKHHPGLSYQPLPGQGADLPGVAAVMKPDFDPLSVERPPRPVSSFDTPAREVFAEPEAPKAAAIAPEPPPMAPEPEAAIDTAPSANTFIAAARRAAQRQQGGGGAKSKSAGGSGSLIARAFASFQTAGKPAEAKGAEPKAAKPVKVQKPKREKKERKLAGDKESPTAWMPDDTGPAVEPKVLTPGAPAIELPPAPVSAFAATAEPRALDQEATAPSVDAPKKESFLTRHRRPILLAATVVAVALLTLNLISQRLSEGEPAPAPAPVPTSDASDAGAIAPTELTAEPIANVAAAVSAGPRVIPIVDSLATASIDAATPTGFTPAEDMPVMPAAFAATEGSVLPPDAAAPAEAIDVAAIAPLSATVEPLAEDIASPVQVDLPPEALGPEPLRRAAAQGDARAQFEIAAIYTEGRAVPEDLVAAAVWYERSAAQGFAPAQYRLGNLYENGRGVTKDLAQAKHWYQLAAEAGNRMAMHNLAALYAGGELGKQEFDAAAQWFEQAAMRGMRDSQFNLGMLYARGLGVTQSLEASYKWFSMAAARGDGDAAKARDDVARSLDADTVSRINNELETFTPAAIDLIANFAPIGTWSDKFDPGETITNGDVIKSVQMALRALGYDVGTPDGLAGPKTAEAIRAFERTTGMSESGAVNPRLLAVLGSQPV